MNTWMQMMSAMAGDQAQAQPQQISAGPPHILNRGRVILGDGKVTYVNNPSESVKINGQEYKWPDDMTIDLSKLRQGEMPTPPTRSQGTGRDQMLPVGDQRAVNMGDAALTMPAGSNLEMNGRQVDPRQQVLDLAPWLNMRRRRAQ